MSTRRQALAYASALGATALAPRIAAASEVNAPPLPAVGEVFAVPSIKRLDGTPFTADPNQVLVLYWWASTCPFCALQSPEMDKLYRAMAPKGMAFLGLSIDKTPQRAQDYLKLKGYVWPSAWVTPAFAQARPKPQGLPITVVRGANARVLQAERGQLFPEDVAEMARWVKG
jgi:thiol-disulfide isomerase/thioredoxin